MNIGYRKYQVFWAGYPTYISLVGADTHQQSHQSLSFGFTSDEFDNQHGSLLTKAVIFCSVYH